MEDWDEFKDINEKNIKINNRIIITSIISIVISLATIVIKLCQIFA